MTTLQEFINALGDLLELRKRLIRRLEGEQRFKDELSRIPLDRYNYTWVDGELRYVNRNLKRIKRDIEQIDQFVANIVDHKGVNNEETES